jgi:hypothetical protein
MRLRAERWSEGIWVESTLWGDILRNFRVLLLRITCRKRAGQAQKRPESEGRGCEGISVREPRATRGDVARTEVGMTRNDVFITQ